MIHRERILLSLVVGPGIAAIAFVGVAKVRKGLSDRRDRVALLQKEIADKEFEVALGERKALELIELEARSLPPSREQAMSVYQAWLLDLVKNAGLQDVDVKLQSNRSVRDVYTMFTFAVTGDGDLPRLTEFLHRFYEADFLHRIGRLNLKPIRDRRELSLSMSVDALALPGSPHLKTLPTDLQPPRDLLTLEEYRTAILGRNLFGPPNNKPRLTISGSQRAYVGRSLTVSPQASDPDKLDSLRYSVAEKELPSGMRFDAQTGSLQWTPRETGEYSVTLIVSDDGLPSKSDSQLVKISVSEPPPPPTPRPTPPAKPSFDPAQYTFLTSVVEINGEPQIWLIDRTTGTRYELSVGDSFDIGTWKGTVVRIGTNSAEVESSGHVYLISIGEPLTSGEELDSV